MTTKGLLSFAAILLTIFAFFPYIRSIWKGKTKPHVFSWVIWGATTFVASIAQMADMGGVGALPVAVSGVLTLYIAFLAYQKKSDISVTRSDTWFFISAASAIPIWILTANPLWATVVLTVVDVLGFGPTFRKAYHHPRDENVLFFSLMVIRNILVIGALEHYSVTTALFPGVTGAFSVVFVLMLVIRRKVG